MWYFFLIFYLLFVVIIPILALIFIFLTAAMVLQCLEIVGVLDAARLDQPNCIEKIYTIIFNGPSKERFEVMLFFL